MIRKIAEKLARGAAFAGLDREQTDLPRLAAISQTEIALREIGNRAVSVADNYTYLN